jgi:hemolysin activation/secretion protein
MLLCCFIRFARQTLTIIVFTGLVLSLTASNIWAAATPDSGAALDSAQIPEKPATQTGLDFKVAEPDLTASTEVGQRIRVNGFRFSGELLVAEAELQQVVSGRAGQDLTLTDLNDVANQVTKYLRGQGYLVAVAYIPPQTIQDGIVEIAIIPGKYGAIILNNQARIADGRLAKMSGRLRPGEVVTRETLEEALLLVNDLPGIAVKATLAPGQNAGTTDITLNVSNTAKYDGLLYTDNRGNRYTGRYRAGFSSDVANIGHYGDALQIGGQTAGDGLSGFNLGYNLPLGYRGTRLAANYSRVDYGLGEDFEELEASGDAQIAGVVLSYPFKRSRHYSLYGTMGYNYKDLYDEIGVTSTVTPRTDKLWNLGLNGQINDKWQGVNQFVLTYFHGDLSIDDVDAAVTDAGHTAGGFNKLLLNYRRRQNLTPKLSVEWRFTAQTADGNLDSSEKLYLGGSEGMRAYPQGEAAADQGWLLSVEFKRLRPQWSNAGNNVYLVNFYDYGYAQLNKDPWEDEDNRRNLAAAGLGLIWARRSFNLRLDYAIKLGLEDAETDTESNGRIWLQMVKYF